MKFEAALKGVKLPSLSNEDDLEKPEAVKVDPKKEEMIANAYEETWKRKREERLNRG